MILRFRFSDPRQVIAGEKFDFTSGSFRQSNIYCIANLEFLYGSSSFSDDSSTVIANLIRETKYVNTTSRKVKRYTHSSFTASFRAPAALLTSIGLMLAA